MPTSLAEKNDQLEITLYSLARRYHGVYEDIAKQVGGKAAALRQAMNPNYMEKPSFVMRTANVFVAWIRLHPRSGMTAFQKFVAYVMRAMPDAFTRKRIEAIGERIGDVRREIEDVNRAIEGLPMIRLQCREIVRKRRRPKAMLPLK